MIKTTLAVLFLAAGLSWGEEDAAREQQVDASTASLNLTINEFVNLALKTGLGAIRNNLEYENARLTRKIAFKQTTAPTLTAALSGDLTQNRYSNPASSSVLTKTDFGEASLTLNQPLPTGTIFSLTGKYNGTFARSPLQYEHDFLRPGWSAALTQPIFVFVKNPVLRSRKKTSLNYDNAADSYRATILDLQAQARALYYDVLLKRESLGVEKRKLAASKALLKVTEELVKAGKLAPVERTRANVRAEQDHRQVLAAVNNLRKSKQNANNFLHAALDQPISYTSQLSYEPFTPTLDALVAYALNHRPELKRLRRAQALAELDLQEAKEPTRPSLDLSAGYDSSDTSNRLSGIGTNKTLTRQWQAGALLSWRFFDSSITSDQARQAFNAKRLADLAYEEGMRATILEVKNAYMDVKALESQLDFQSIRESARENIEILRIQVQHGSGRIIDVFDAENEAKNIDLQYLNLLVNYYLTQDRLAQLLGSNSNLEDI